MIMINEPHQMVGVRLPLTLLDEIETMAKEDYRNRASMIIKLLVEAVEERNKNKKK